MNNDDTARLKFLAQSVNHGCVYISEKETNESIVRLYSRLSDWLETTKGDKFTLDDLRLLVDEAMSMAEAKK